MTEDRKRNLVLGVPKQKLYVPGVAFVASVFTFFISALAVFQLLLFPEPKRTADGLLATYLGLVALAFVVLVASGAYLVRLVTKEGDPK